MIKTIILFITKYIEQYTILYSRYIVDCNSVAVFSFYKKTLLTKKKCDYAK